MFRRKPHVEKMNHVVYPLILGFGTLFGRVDIEYVSVGNCHRQFWPIPWIQDDSDNLLPHVLLRNGVGNMSL